MHKEILRLAIPNIISNISIPLLSTVDTILMGQLSARHLGAIGIGAMIYNFIYWNFGFLRMGTTGITAQAYGRKDQKEIIHTLLRALLIAFGLAFMVMVSGYWIVQISHTAFNIIPDQSELVEQYFYIRLIAAPAALSLLVLNGWFFGMQNAFYPLYITITINVINIIISYYAVKHLMMGTSGVAWGTVISQYIGVMLAIYFLMRNYKSNIKAYELKILFQLDRFKRFLEINSDIFIRTIFLTTAFAFFTSKSSAGGELYLAVNLILLQLLNWLSYGVDGFAYAAESMVGKYKGAQEPQNLMKAIKYSILWGAAFAICYSLIYGFAYDPIIHLFTSDQQVIAASAEYRYWMVILPVAGFLCYIWDGIYVGLTAAKAMRNSCFMAFVAYILCYYSMQNFIQQHAIWLAMLVFLSGRGVLQTLLFYRYGTKLN